MQKIALGLFLVMLFFVSTGLARADNPEAVVPEKNGDYAEPGRSGVRVRVFVHEPKGHQEVIPGPTLGCVDPASNSVVHPAGWKLPGMVTYRLNPSSVPSTVGAVNLATITSNGFNEWRNAVATASSRPVLVQGANTLVSKSAYDGQNVIAWGRTSGSALGVTYVRYYTSTGYVVDVDTIMNKKFAWSWSGNTNSCGSPNAYDAQNILTHELGHWMGLDDEYATNYVDNTMYGYGAENEVKKDTLTGGDVIGVKNLYP